MKIIKFVRQNRQFGILSILALFILLVALFAPVIATHNPYEAVLQDALQAPGKDHLFGTDVLGRDLYSRILYGTSTSISSAFILVSIIFIIGTGLGIIAGYFGGVIEGIIMRISDIMISFPDLILVIAIAGILGPSLGNAIIAITVVSWTKYARLARSLVLKIMQSDYIAAARLTGSKTSHILMKYLFPNILPILIVTAATDIGSIILQLASLSFLGFGAQPPTPEWGYMLSEGREFLQRAPWLLVFPGLAIFIVVVIFNLFGDSLRDILDPNIDKESKSLRKREKENEFKKDCKGTSRIHPSNWVIKWMWK